MTEEPKVFQSHLSLQPSVQGTGTQVSRPAKDSRPEGREAACQVSSKPETSKSVVLSTVHLPSQNRAWRTRAVSTDSEDTLRERTK